MKYALCVNHYALWGDLYNVLRIYTDGDLRSPLMDDVADHRTYHRQVTKSMYI